MNSKLLLIFAMVALYFTEAQALGSEPVECTPENEGSCNCANESEGFKTYTFMVNDVQRCFTTYIPPDLKHEKLPLMMLSQCYARDKLVMMLMKDIDSPINGAARQFGFARIAISTPNGHWKFPNDAIINDTNPMPCSDSDSEDLIYMRKVFEWIESKNDQFDLSRVYAHGFSQNSVWSSVIGVCFNEKVRGMFLFSSGMSIKEQELVTTSCGGWVSSSSNKKCKQEESAERKVNRKGKGGGKKKENRCEKCANKYPCDDCKYFPIYPCYTPKKPLIVCMSDYKNDYTTNAKDDPDCKSSIKNMYLTMSNEGYDARLFRFSPSSKMRSDDETIKGSHQTPQNDELWMIGCLGLSSFCSEECEAKVIECTESGDISTARARTETFKGCMSEDYLSSIDCPSNCAPTFNMLASSQIPDTFGDFNFGDIEYSENSLQPESSLCNADDQ